MVAVLIGANNYGFADIVQQCVVDFLTSPTWWKDYCYDDSSVSSRFTAGNQAAITTQVAGAFQNLRTAMRNAGYADNAWTLESRPTPRRCRAARASATRSPATRASRRAAAASGTGTPTGPTTRPSWR